MYHVLPVDAEVRYIVLEVRHSTRCLPIPTRHHLPWYHVVYPSVDTYVPPDGVVPVEVYTSVVCKDITYYAYVLWEGVHDAVDAVSGHAVWIAASVALDGIVLASIPLTAYGTAYLYITTPSLEMLWDVYTYAYGGVQVYICITTSHPHTLQVYA